jgi:hypothetical protein
MTQVVGHLPSKHYALSLQASIKKKKKLTKWEKLILLLTLLHAHFHQSRTKNAQRKTQSDSNNNPNKHYISLLGIVFKIENSLNSFRNKKTSYWIMTILVTFIGTRNSKNMGRYRFRITHLIEF